MKRTHRQKELTEVQSLKEENKKLRDENRSLKKQIRQLQKQEHLFEETNYEDKQLNLFDEPKVEKCPLCFKGSLKNIDILGRCWKECTLCEYDTRKKK